MSKFWSIIDLSLIWRYTMLYSVQMKVTWLLWQQMWYALLEENVSGESTIRHVPRALLKDRDHAVQEQAGTVHCNFCNRLFRSRGGLVVHRCREEEALVVGPQASIVCAKCGRSFTWIRKLNKPSNIDLQLHKTEILELIANYCEFCA